MDVRGPRLLEAAGHVDRLVAEHHLTAGAGGHLARRHVEVEDARVTGLHGEAQLLLAEAQRLVGGPSFDGVAHGARHQRTSRLALGEVVLRAAPHGLQRELLIGETGEEDDGQAGSGRPHPLEGLDALAVGQGEVEQHGVERLAGRDPLEPLGEGLHPLWHEACTGFGQQFADEPRIAGIVLDEEDAEPVHSRLGVGRQRRRRCWLARHRLTRTRPGAAGRRSARMTPPT